MKFSGDKIDKVKEDLSKFLRINFQSQQFLFVKVCLGYREGLLSQRALV